MVVMCGVTPTTDVGRTLVQATGGAFTDGAPTFLQARVATVCAYGGPDNLCGILCNDGTNSYLYVNADPTNAAGWVQVKQFAGYGVSGGLAVVGSVWSVQVSNGTDNRIMYSGDVGSAYAAVTNANFGTANAFLTGGLTTATPGSLSFRRASAWPGLARVKYTSPTRWG